MDFQTILFADDGDIPNSRFPLIVYSGVIDSAAAVPASAFEALFGRNRWGNGWRNGIYPFHHYHSTAHEVLGIAAGHATVRMGGEAGGQTLTVKAGDALLIPAGVGHKRLSSDSGLLVIGAYPRGQSPDLIREGAPQGPAIRARIAAVPSPETDPVTGAAGPMWEAWR
jgi:uncharacterized protein YjlB